MLQPSSLEEVSCQHTVVQRRREIETRSGSTPPLQGQRDSTAPSIPRGPGLSFYKASLATSSDVLGVASLASTILTGVLQDARDLLRGSERDREAPVELALVPVQFREAEHLHSEFFHR